MTALLYEYADRQARSRPGATAVVMGDERLTYGELAARSDRLARVLRERGCQGGDRVAIYAAKSPLAIVAMHAINKVGAAYVPLDPASPPPRIARVLSASEPSWILAAGAAAKTLGPALEDYPHVPPRLGWLGDGDQPTSLQVDFDADDVSATPAEYDPARGLSTTATHLLFTSGSTGVPKGVVITHANVIAFVEWANSYFGTNEADRVSGHSPFHFDLSTFDIYGAFRAGAELHLVPPSLNLMAPKLANLIREARLTQWFSVPSALTYMAKFDVIEQDDFPDLRRLLWCGEVFPTPSLIHWMERLPHVTFTNLYGPTEATIASSYHTLVAVPAEPTESIPIGRPCAGEELRVLDEDLRSVAPGEIGDLYIAGVGLSPGYWRDPDQTASAFRQAPDDARVYRTGDRASVGSDGSVYFRGRTDAQIKSRGHRIELGEIESALSTDERLRANAVVAVPTDGFEGWTICCAYVPANGVEVSPVDLRGALKDLVPGYMIPSRWLALERLPQNPNGKTDRPALRARFAEPA